jgi:hypothetical protein
MMESENFKGVKFCRIKELEVNDLMLYMGLWRKVLSIDNGWIKYKDIAIQQSRRPSIRANSMQFVEVLKSPKPVNNKPL